MSSIFIHSGYVLMFAALVVRDILWLRAILIAAQSSLLTYGVFAGNNAVIFWNGLLPAINIIQIIRLANERRPIALSGGLQSIYERTFSSLRPREFLYLWNMGSEITTENQNLITRGQKQKDIALILNGKVNILRDGNSIARLGRGSFIAEMSFLTGKPATADVRAVGKVSLLSWPQNKLHHLQSMNTPLFIKFQNILGKDLARKVNPDSKE